MGDRDSTKDVALDLASLNGEEFEKLVAAIFRAKSVPAPSNQTPPSESVNPTVISILHSGRGADQGRDLLVTTVVNDGVIPRQFKWVVECKHYAVSGKSVQLSDFQNSPAFPDIVAHHHANGYLLVCSTIPSVNVQSLFESLTAQNNNPYLFIIWDDTKICEELNRHLDVMKQFFPHYYHRYHERLMDADGVLKWAKERCASEKALSNFSKALDEVMGEE
jgi:hypothetical protein